MSELGIAIFKLIKEHEPDIGHADPASIAKVVSALATNLGGILAAVAIHHGEDGVVEVVDQFTKRVDTSASGIVGKTIKSAIRRNMN